MRFFAERLLPSLLAGAGPVRIPATNWQDVGARGVGIPLRGQGLRAVGFGSSQVMLLGAVGDDIVKTPRLVGNCDEFVLSIEDSAIAFVFPENRVTSFQRFAGEGRAQTDAFEWCRCFAFEFTRVFGAADIETGGHDVNDVAGLGFE